MEKKRREMENKRFTVSNTWAFSAIAGDAIALLLFATCCAHLQIIRQQQQQQQDDKSRKTKREELEKRNRFEYEAKVSRLGSFGSIAADMKENSIVSYSFSHWTVMSFFAIYFLFQFFFSCLMSRFVFVSRDGNGLQNELMHVFQDVTVIAMIHLNFALFKSLFSSGRAQKSCEMTQSNIRKRTKS